MHKKQKKTIEKKEARMTAHNVIQARNNDHYDDGEKNIHIYIIDDIKNNKTNLLKEL
jgi:hypothetical protein